MVLMVASLVPHIAEELWRKLGHTETVTYLDFPSPIRHCWWTTRSNFRCRSTARCAAASPCADATAAIIEQTALGDDKVIAALAGSTRRRSSSCQAAWSTSSPDQRIDLSLRRACAVGRCRSRLQHTALMRPASSIVRSRCPPSASINLLSGVRRRFDLEARLTTLGVR